MIPAHLVTQRLEAQKKIDDRLNFTFPKHQYFWQTIRKKTFIIFMDILVYTKVFCDRSLNTKMTTVTDLPSLLEDMMKPSSSLFDADFDLNLLKNDEVLRALMPTHGVTTLRCANFQKRRFSDKTICDESNLPTVDASGFHVNVDMKAFKEEEIVVKTSGNQLIVEGKQEEVQGAKGTLRRHFVRRYVIPEHVDLEKVECRLTEDGFLAVNVPLKETVPSIAEEERVIPIISATQDKVEKPEGDAEKEEPAEEGEDHEDAQEEGGCENPQI